MSDPDRALDLLGLDDWVEGGSHTPLELGFRHVNAPDSKHFLERIEAVNKRLRGIGEVQPLSMEHFVALRLYTGPCYCKCELGCVERCYTGCAKLTTRPAI